MNEIAQSLSAFDTWVFHLVNGGLSNDFLDVAMPYLTRVRHWRIPLGLLWLYLFFYAGQRGRIVALLMIPAIAVSDVGGSRVIKHLVERDRPCETFDDVHLLVGCARSSSLPSIHALNIFTAATLFSAFYGPWIRLLAFSIALMVGFSRVYVGVHYPLDVLAGAALGAGWGILVTGTYKRLRSKEPVPVLAPRTEHSA